MKIIRGVFVRGTLAVCVAIFARDSDAYLAVSHAEMTEQAYLVLNERQTSLATSLGFRDWEESASLPVSPGASAEDRGISFLEIISVGAHNEDNIHEVIDGHEVGSRRPIQHFFNPQVLCDDGPCNGLFGQITASPDWIFENQSKWGGGPSESPDNQLFSYVDARHYQACAFFPLRDGSCDVPGYPGLTSDFERRRANAGYLFQSLGHVVHHIQDMAQPQHVRLDAHYHSGNVERGDPSWLGTEHDDAQALETMLNAVLLNIGALALRWKIHEPSRFEALAVDEVRRQIQTGEIDGYVHPVRVETPRNFWTNLAFTGMADYTSQNFPSAETQYGLVKTAAFAQSEDLLDLAVTRYDGEMADFVDLPYPDGASAWVTRSYLTPPDSEEGDAYYIADTIYDPNSGTLRPNGRMARIGLFTKRLGRHIELNFRIPGIHAYETDETIRSHLELLVPRAVAFSKAFLEYFFRGQLSLELAYSREQGAFIPSVTNMTPNERMSGAFTVVRIAENGDTEELRVSSGRMLPGEPLQLDPIPLNDVRPSDRVGVLFRGWLGAEHENVTSVTGTLPVETVDIRVRKAGLKYELVNSGTTPFSGTIVLKDDGVVMEDAVTGKAEFMVDLQPGDKVSGLELPVGAGVDVEIVLDGVSGEYAAVVKTPFQYVAGLIACSEGFTRTGGSEGLDEKFDLGERAGTACITFDARDIPDRMQVYLGAEKVYDSELIYGSLRRAVHFDPQKLDTTKIRVKVIGNDDEGTRWTVAVSCPRTDTDCDEYDNDYADYSSVEFSLYNPGHYCVRDASLHVNGEKLWEGEFYFQQRVRATLAKGEWHRFELRTETNGSIFCGQPVSVTITAGSALVPWYSNGTFRVP